MFSLLVENWKYLLGGLICQVLGISQPSAVDVDSVFDYRNSELNYSNIFGGLREDDACETTTTSRKVSVNTEAVAYMFTYGLSASASTRVSNELGADNSDKAKHAVKVTLKLSIILAIAVVLDLVFGHDMWVASFSNSSIIIEEFASVTPLLVISIVVDSIQEIFSGVAKGCGRKHLAVYINLAMFYLIGMLIAVLLGFTLKLYAKTHLSSGQSVFAYKIRSME